MPAIPPVIAMNPVEWATAQLLGGIACPNTMPGFPPDACNPLLALTPFQFLPPVQPLPNSVETGSSKDDQTTWTASISFDVNDYVNIYARAATGFKASSWNLFQDSKPTAEDAAALDAAGELVPNLTPGTRFADPEDSTVYEIGLKSGWSNGTLNVTAFTQEIEGFQSNVFIGTAFNLINAGKQSTDGVELEFNWIPIEALSLRFDATWLDPVYDSFETAACVGEICDLSGTTARRYPRALDGHDGAVQLQHRLQHRGLYSDRTYLRGRSTGHRERARDDYALPAAQRDSDDRYARSQHPQCQRSASAGTTASKRCSGAATSRTTSTCRVRSRQSHSRAATVATRTSRRPTA